MLDETPKMVGMTPSIPMSLFEPNEPVDPGVGSVKFAAVPAEFLIDPPFSERADELI